MISSAWALQSFTRCTHFMDSVIGFDQRIFGRVLYPYEPVAGPDAEVLTSPLPYTPSSFCAAHSRPFMKPVG